MKMIKVKMADPSRRMWNPVSASYLTGDTIAKVPDVTFWRRRIKDGTLCVAESDTPSSATFVQTAGDFFKPKKRKGK